MIAEPLDKEATADADRDAERATVKTSVKRVYRLIDDNLASVGGIESAAGICGVDRGDLRRAIDHQTRFLSIDHVMAIAARMRRFNAATATQIASAIVHPMDLLVFPRIELKPEEKARRLEQLIRSMPLGEQLLRSALETP